ncbi:YybH family protein [Sunxiuqinia sp. A32]|uniref:YybH family protein n=1 Tax=Sunxiuqinia sp. A32 TaxID=3461496 RepID=UPI0040458536
MKKLKIIFLLIAFVSLFTHCSQNTANDMLESYREEVRITELNFSKMANEESIGAAFNFYASDDVVLSRGNQLLKGKESLSKYFENPIWDSIKLEWSPDFIDVSSSGDLAYTYGNYTLAQLDSIGQETKTTGIFHTVWKKQENGEWKFVWD